MASPSVCVACVSLNIPRNECEGMFQSTFLVVRFSALCLMVRYPLVLTGRSIARWATSGPTFLGRNQGTVCTAELAEEWFSEGPDRSSQIGAHIYPSFRISYLCLELARALEFTILPTILKYYVLLSRMMKFSMALAAART